MTDTPGFMRGMTDSPEDREIQATLRDDILVDEETPPAQTGEESAETPPADTTGHESQNTETPPAEVGTDSENPTEPGTKKIEAEGEHEDEPDTTVEDILKKKPEERTEDEVKALAEAKDLTEDQIKQIESEKPKVEEKDETPEAKVDPVKAIDKAQEQMAQTSKISEEKRNEIQKNVAMAQKYPLIFPELPKKEDFDLEDGDFDLAGYMKAYTNNLVLAIQSSIVGGPLSASVFGILQEAINEEQVSTAQAAESNAKANEVLNKLQIDFPVLKTDKELEGMFDDVLQGILVKRQAEAEKTGKELEPLTYEDMRKIMLRLVGTPSRQTTPQEQDPTERPASGTPLNLGGAVARDEIDDAIEGMKQAKMKGMPF